MGDKPTTEERLSLLEKENTLIGQVSETVEKIFGSLATLPGGERGLLDGHKDLMARHDQLRKEFDLLRTEIAGELASLKKTIYIASGAVSAIVFIIEYALKR